MWLPMYVKGSEGYLSQLAGDRLGSTAGVGACGICLGRLDRHGGCGHMIAAAFDSDTRSAHPHPKKQQCDVELMSATNRWRLPLRSLEFHTCWRPSVIRKHV